MKIAIITCYKQPDYVRALVLRVALVANPENKIYIIKNRQLGLLRYPEVLMKLLIIRFKHRPDAYLLTFRGYEVLPAVNVVTWPKPLIFDEFINPLEWLHEPRPERWARFVPKKVLRRIYRLFLRRSKFILADTAAHTSYSA